MDTMIDGGGGRERERERKRERESESEREGNIVTLYVFWKLF